MATDEHDNDTSIAEMQDDAPAFTFTAPKAELFELAIIHVEGGTGVPLSENASRRRLEIMAYNREALAVEVFDALSIPPAMRGDAVEPRPLKVIGHDKR